MKDFSDLLTLQAPLIKVKIQVNNLLIKSKVFTVSKAVLDVVGTGVDKTKTFLFSWRLLYHRGDHEQNARYVIRSNEKCYFYE